MLWVWSDVVLVLIDDDAPSMVLSVFLVRFVLWKLETWRLFVLRMLIVA